MTAPTDYDEERDGNLLIKASALNAAFTRYHQKYLLDRTAVMHYRGSVATVAALSNISNSEIGDVYNVTATGENYAYDGSDWDNLGSVVSLDGYATESYVTSAIAAQHDFGTVAVGSTNIVAGSASDTLTLTAGSNVTLTPDASTKSVTIAATDTTYSEASASAAGLLSATDYSAIHALGTAANANTASSVTNGGTGLPTEDAVYDFVTGLGYQTSTQVSNAISTALGNELTPTQAQDMIDDIWNSGAVMTADV